MCHWLTNPSEVRKVKEFNTACNWWHIVERMVDSSWWDQSEPSTMIPRHVSKLRSFRYTSSARRTPNSEQLSFASALPVRQQIMDFYSMFNINNDNKGNTYLLLLISNTPYLTKSIDRSRHFGHPVSSAFQGLSFWSPIYPLRHSGPTNCHWFGIPAPYSAFRCLAFQAASLTLTLILDSVVGSRIQVDDYAIMLHINVCGRWLSWWVGGTFSDWCPWNLESMKLQLSYDTVS